MSQFSIPCCVYRGGTSRGLFFHKKDLPSDVIKRNKIFLNGVDAYNLSQINGLGSGTSHTSKVCVIAPSLNERADVDFTFYQIGIGKEVVDDNGTCGNLMAAVGAFAVDEKLLSVDMSMKRVTVKVYNTNIKAILEIQVPLINGKAKVSGDYLMPGVVNKGAMIRVAILNPGGGKTGKTLPLGTEYTLQITNEKYEVSFVDVINPFVFISSDVLGFSCTKSNSEMSLNQPLIDKLNLIRDEMAVVTKMANSLDEASRITPSVPKIGMVAKPQEYTTTSGKLIRKEEVDIICKMISMGKLHRTSPASGLFCLAAAVLLPGTIPNQLAAIPDGTKALTVRIGHPDGVVEVRVVLTTDGLDVESVGMDRSARRIMKGELFTPLS